MLESTVKNQTGHTTSDTRALIKPPLTAGIMSAFPETMRVRTMSRPESGRHSMLPSDAAVDAFRERLSNFAPQGTMMSPAALMSPSVNARGPRPAATNQANPLGGGGMPTVQQPSRVIGSQAPFTGGDRESVRLFMRREGSG